MDVISNKRPFASLHYITTSYALLRGIFPLDNRDNDLGYVFFCHKYVIFFILAITTRLCYTRKS